MKLNNEQSIDDLMSQIEAYDQISNPQRKVGRRTKAESEWVRTQSTTGQTTIDQRIAGDLNWEIDTALPSIVFVYTRVSDLKKDSVTFERQNADIVELAKREGVDLTNAIFLSEEGSAYKKKHRPEFDKMIKTIESYNGKNQIIVIASELTRLFRNVDVANRVLSVFRSKKVILRLCNNASLDILDPNFDMMLSFHIQMAESSSASTAYRQTGAHKIRAARGEYRGGGVPFGMTTEKRITPSGEKSFLKINREPNTSYPTELIIGTSNGIDIKIPTHILSESDLVKEMFSRSSRGDTLTDIAVWLNANGFATARFDTGFWSQTVIKKTLTNPHYTGRVVYKSKVVKDDLGNDLIVNEAFIDDDTFALVQSRLDALNRVPGTRRSYKLSGLLFCATCDCRMSGRPGNATSNRSYGCRTHSVNKDTCAVANYIVTDGIEKLIYDLISKLAETKPEMLKKLATREEVIDQHADKRAELTLKLASLEEQIKNEVDSLELEGLKHMHGIASKQIVELEQDAYGAALQTRVAFEGAAQFKQAWDSGNRTHLFLALRTILDKVVIHPAKSVKKMNWKSLNAAGWPCNLHRVTIHWANGAVMNLGEIDPSK